MTVFAEEDADDKNKPEPGSIVKNNDTIDQEPLYLADVVVTARRRLTARFIQPCRKRGFYVV